MKSFFFPGDKFVLEDLAYWEEDWGYIYWVHNDEN